MRCKKLSLFCTYSIKVLVHGFKKCLLLLSVLHCVPRLHLQGSHYQLTLRFPCDARAVRLEAEFTSFHITPLAPECMFGLRQRSIVSNKWTRISFKGPFKQPILRCCNLRILYTAFHNASSAAQRGSILPRQKPRQKYPSLRHTVTYLGQ